MTDELRQQLVFLSHDFHRRGWCLATSGNFSARIDPHRFLITASGKDKAFLKIDDFVELDLEGHYENNADLRPSSETLLHAALYKHAAEINCILHTHSVWSNMLSMKHFDDRKLLLKNYEMLKAFDGVYTHHHVEVVPILPNSQDMLALSHSMIDLLQAEPEPHGLLIQAHGLYTWGKSIADAKRHVEAFEFLLECEGRT
jgi:methylthioribulose-1-phosphate dehydratase